MAGPVSTISCSHPYVCRAEDDNNNLPPVMLGSGGGVGADFEPPTQIGRTSGRFSEFCKTGAGLGVAGSATYAGTAALFLEDDEEKMDTIQYSALIATAFAVGFVLCPRGGSGNPPSGGTPKDGKNPYFDHMSGKHRTTTGWTSARESLEPSLDWKIPAGLAALLGLALLKNPQAGAAVLQGAGAVALTSESVDAFLVSPNAQWSSVGYIVGSENTR